MGTGERNKGSWGLSQQDTHLLSPGSCACTLRRWGITRCVREAWRICRFSYSGCSRTITPKITCQPLQLLQLFRLSPKHGVFVFLTNRKFQGVCVWRCVHKHVEALCVRCMSAFKGEAVVLNGSEHRREEGWLPTLHESTEQKCIDG